MKKPSLVSSVPEHIAIVKALGGWRVEAYSPSGRLVYRSVASRVPADPDEIPAGVKLLAKTVADTLWADRDALPGPQPLDLLAVL